MRGLFSVVVVVVTVTVAMTVVVHADPQDPVRQRLRAMRAFTLTEELVLDEPTAARLFPALAKYDAEGDKIAVRRADVQHRLATTTAHTDPRVIDTMIDEAIANQRWQRDFEDRRLGELRTLLSAVQAARIVVLLPRFDEQIYPADGVLRLRGPQPSPDALDDDAPMLSPTLAPAPAPTRTPTGKQRRCDPFNDRHGC
ncbi:MAG: hypothetical protein NT062_37635 [Proteobacteria bacterium]|nr:hypothetical protein [Pseudomonadota bacterium]